jgi:hypothetical protein
VIVYSSDVVGWSATRLAAWLPRMLEDSRYKRIPNLEARVTAVIKDLEALELELLKAEGRKLRGP